MSFALATNKEGPLKLDSRHSLSLKLLRVVLLAALAVGVVLSCAQIVFDAYKAKQAVSSDAQRILAMVRDPSTQAVYSLDREMAMQVLEGLFQHEAVRQASIGHPGEPMLAEKSRPLLDLPTRWLTDPILGQERTFSIRLIGRPPYSEYYGDLKITLDTAPYGENFVTTSEIIFISGILRALAMGLVLFLVYHWMLTKPLSKIIEHLVSINPDRPSQHQLPLLKGHERNELGLWVTTANQLLARSKATATCVARPKTTCCAFPSTTSSPACRTASCCNSNSTRSSTAPAASSAGWQCCAWASTISRGSTSSTPTSSATSC